VTEPAASPRDRSASADELLAARYGRRSPRQRWVMILAVAVLALAFLGWLLWAAWFQSTASVTGDLQSYDVVSEHEVRVTVEVRRSSGAAVTCTVRASAADHGVVGDQQVTIPAGESGTVTYEATITTDRRASSATVSDCH
jgi:type II secretory pathway component PulM